MLDGPCKVPYSWQLDAAESLILGVDSIVIAGTGAGKTMPFVMPLMRDKSKGMLIISPLKALQRDQELMEHAYQAILVSPEMCLEHDGFRQLLKLPDFTGTLIGIIIDEAHCITQWGGEFRTSYDKENLQIHPTKSFFVNLGNDQPNITPSVTKIKSQRDYSSLLDLVATGVLGPSDLSKTIIFTNSIQKTHEILRFLRQHLPRTCGKHIANFHALRSTRAKQQAMKEF
ncbi:hypothetical protein SCLCIDRAFT_17455 [Scleroderma citrinum Foug A]|uniref:DNA 3'-5' helicase n=1 Tax=Scleroderma citrinum Foug A TaxID=1036808 RepID=A0A0C2YZZ8_9AGAM|nr:hypothetical protein SCLCIDRAFT_17455 [Scleroderma citrinum Foug A]